MTRVANNLKTVLAYAWTAFLLLFSIDVAAVPERPEPARFVNDLALMFDQSQAETLERRLAVYSDTTTTQIVVVTVPDLEGQDAASYATELGINWQIGSEKFDNGVVILIKPKNDNGSGEVFIAVGYGLEGAIPDAYAKRIIEEIMIPKFIEDDYFGAVNAANLDGGSSSLMIYEDEIISNKSGLIANREMPTCFLVERRDTDEE